MKRRLALLCLLPLLAAARPVIVLAPGEGDNAPAIKAALASLRQEKGGDLILTEGTYWIGAELSLDGLVDARIVGQGEVTLRLMPQRWTRTTREAKQGDTELFLRHPEVFAPGLIVEIQGTTRETFTPDGKPHRIPYLNHTVREVLPDRIVLTKPLATDIATDAPVLHPMNLFDGRRDIRNVTIQGLVLDLNRESWPVAPLNHSHHSGIFLHGPYSYEKGPVGPPLEGIRIIGCTVRNAHHRGIAFYCARDSAVYGCHLENTGAEGIDFDHFVSRCTAVGNTLVNCQNLELNDASDCLVADNLLRDCRAGIVVWQWCQLPGLNERNFILGNRFENCPPPLVALRQRADGNTVLGNAGTVPKGPALAVDGTANLIGENAFQADQGPVLRLAPGNLQPGHTDK
ncbi:MAG: right-handed parallel beta-helix repeat-containing protein [Lentisphaeria bacterium]|jgi:hypothetical protein|nr:right-handed parallel beta-helix repeat-containing protein [Lentisphaeria bacterium]